MSNNLNLSWIEIDLSCLDYNFKQIKRLISSQTKILATVKSNAYGHGLIEISRRLIELGVDYLGVADIEEAVRLRKEGISCPILILGTILPNQIKELFKYNLIPTVCSKELALALRREAEKMQKITKIHLKLDTGMGRLGILWTESIEFVQWLKSLKYIRLEGVFTHLSSAEEDPYFTREQIDRFKRIITYLKEKLNLKIPLVHVANSMGIIGYKESHFNLVRPGLMLYGIYPCRDLKNIVKLKPLLTLKSKVIFQKKIPAGWPVSYDQTFVASKQTTIAIIPLGYGDGYPRSLSNKASVLIKGKFFKLIGRICMDLTIINIGKEKISIGEEVVLLGRQNKKTITAEELAKLADTIPYEIVCSLGNHLPRIYKY